MKHISIREFNLHPTKYLEEVPIVLTQYGKPKYVLTHFEESANTKQESANTSNNKVLTHLQEMLDTPPESVNTLPPQPPVIPGKTAQCPRCDAVVPIQLANKHYMENHEV